MHHKVFSEWNRGLYEGAVGNHEQARAILFYKAGFYADKPGREAKEINLGMAYVFLALDAQERLIELFQARRVKLTSDDERTKYLSMQFLLQEAFGKRKTGGQAVSTTALAFRHCHTPKFFENRARCYFWSPDA